MHLEPYAATLPPPPRGLPHHRFLGSHSAERGLNHHSARIDDRARSIDEAPADRTCHAYEHTRGIAAPAL